MKKILVVSDDHGHREYLEMLVQKYPNFDYYLHAGDSEEYEQNLYPFISVKGNNDYYMDKLTRIITIDNHRIFLTHGHRTFLSKNVMISTCKNNNCDIYIHGHTHRPYYECVDGIHMLCPGSLTYPRSFFGASYAIITIDGDDVKVELKKF
ncbi:MAG: YfcE family phosphodiesterase [Bacilli bacterium]